MDDTYILYLSEDNFKTLFDEKDIELIIESSNIKTAQKAAEEIVSSQKWKNIKKSALVGAAQNFEEKPRSSLDFIKKSHQIQSFLEKAYDPKLRKERNKDSDITIIKTKKSRKVVKDAHYLEVQNLADMSTRRVRFSTSFYNGF